MNKIRVGIIGTGNIGTDLLIKVLKSKDLEMVSFVGRRSDSDGILKAQSLNVNTSTEGLDYFVKNNNVDIVFDCTDAFTGF